LLSMCGIVADAEFLVKQVNECSEQD
jgi:hypothetical protein